MKEEALFRGLTTQKFNRHGFNNIWVEGDLIISGGKYYIHPRANKVRVNGEPGKLIVMHEVFPNSVGWFTGLYTASKRKLWSGDIVRFGNALYVVQRECDTPGGYWAETGYILKRIGGSDYMSFTDTIDDYYNEICVEVVGNVYDNIELLEVPS